MKKFILKLKSKLKNIWEEFKSRLPQLVVILLIVGVAHFTIPSEGRQIEKAREELRVHVRKEIKKNIKNKDVLTQGIGKTVMEDTDRIDALINEKYSIELNDCFVFSLIKVKAKDTGEKRLMGIALFGFILEWPFWELI